MNSNNYSNSSVRIYATAYRSATLPGDADFCWAAMSPLTSIAGWGCSIVDRCEIDPTNERIRLVYLVPANPSDVVLIREKCVKNERSPGGEKGTVVFENLIADDDTTSFLAKASPYPVRIIEMTTSLTISKITTMSSPLGRSFVELRSSFVVESPEDANSMRDFLENNLFEPLLHSAAEMLIPCQPFRDAMFHSVMKHFESSIEKLIDSGLKLQATERVVLRNGITNNNNNNSAINRNDTSPTRGIRQDSDENAPHISISKYTSSAVSVTQEVYSAWLETSRELRRIEKKYEELQQQMEEWKDSTLLRRPENQHHMTARYEKVLMNEKILSPPSPSTTTTAAQYQNSQQSGDHFQPSYSNKHEQVVAASRKPFDYVNDVSSPASKNNNNNNNPSCSRQGMFSHTSANLPMQDAIALNVNNIFGHKFFSNDGDVAGNSSNNKSVGRYEKIAAVVMLPRTEDWHQEVFYDGKDHLVEQDGGVGDHKDHRFMSPRGIGAENVNNGDDAPPLPPRRVLGNK